MSLSSFGPFRIIGKGSSTLADGTNTTVLTFTRKPKERMLISSWVTDDVGSASTDIANDAPGGSAINIFVRRSVTSQEGKLRIQNKSGATRTIQWLLLGIKI